MSVGRRCDGVGRYDRRESGPPLIGGRARGKLGDVQMANEKDVDSTRPLVAYVLGNELFTHAAGA